MNRPACARAKAAMRIKEMVLAHEADSAINHLDDSFQQSDTDAFGYGLGRGRRQPQALQNIDDPHEQGDAGPPPPPPRNPIPGPR